MEAPTLCPRCGAYWGCDCTFEELRLPVNNACDHDWVSAVGVELDPDLLVNDGAEVMTCRLCGLYAVAEKR